LSVPGDLGYDASQLRQMTVSGHTLYFTYDASGTPLSVTYDGTTYYYLTNLQGDVIAILSGSGQTVVTYTYDAWGNPVSFSGITVPGLRELNPLRYRGYVYDEETGLYYLQSRYYNPAWGRFISADRQLNDNILGANLFTYCENNSVNKVDYDGEDGKRIELAKGWYCRIDPSDTTTGTQRHLHIWNDRKGISYAQNENGSPHDKNNNSKGKLPNWLQMIVQLKTGWDYNGNRKSFFGKTKYEHWVEGIHYTFADGTTSFQPTNSFMVISYSVDSYEGIYFKSKKVSNGTINNEPIVYVPIIRGNILPIKLPSFGFGWGALPFLLFA